MALAHPLPFGALLKRERLARGLTQEALAERAGLSHRAISDLERGVNRAPRKETLRLLADALQLAPDERARLETAYRWSTAAPATAPLRERWVSFDAAPVPLAGRARELARIGQQLAGEGPRLLLLAGEPGIGKSRLLEEAAQRASAQGWTVLAGGCHRQSWQAPYTPLLGALATYLQRQPLAQGRLALEGCTWLVRLLPELAEQGLLPSAPWKLPPEQERRLMFAAVERFLSNVAGPAGTLLVLDDLQWAGADALELLQSLLRAAGQLSLRVVGSYRSTEVRQEDPVAALVADLAAAGLAAQLDLAPLAPTEATTLLVSLLEGSEGGDGKLTEQIIRRAGGVPFFLVSCVQAVRQQPETVPEAIPWTVAQSIRQRVAVLSMAARDLLGAAAVIGRAVPRALLFALALQPEREALTALEAACQARLLAEEAEGYQFPHDLIREVVLTDLSAARRRLLHRLVAQALEQQPGEPPVGRLAHHYYQAGVLEKAAHHLQRAGEGALAVHANAEAESLYQQLVAVFLQLGQSADAAKAQEQLARALDGQARYSEALTVLESVLAVYEKAGDHERQAQVTAYIGQLHSARGTPQAGIALLEPWLDTHTELTVSVRAQSMLYLTLSFLYQNSGHPAEAAAVAQQTVELTSRLGDERLLGRALWYLGRSLILLNRQEEAIPQFERALPLAERAKDAPAIYYVLLNLSMVYEARGELNTAKHYAERTLAIAEHLGNPSLVAFILNTHGYNAFQRGEWRQAREEYEQAITLLRQAKLPWGATYSLFNLGTLLMVEGQWESAAPYFEEALAAAEQKHEWASLRSAQCDLAERDLLFGQPQRAYDRLAPLLVGLEQQESGLEALLTMLAWAHLERGEPDQTRYLLDQVLPNATHHHLRPILVTGLSVRARLEARCGNWQEATQALDKALRLARTIEHPYAEAKVLHTAGCLLLQQEEPAHAYESFTQALAMLNRLGERLYARQIEQALATLEEAEIGHHATL